MKTKNYLECARLVSVYVSSQTRPRAFLRASHVVTILASNKVYGMDPKEVLKTLAMKGHCHYTRPYGSRCAFITWSERPKVAAQATLEALDEN